MCTSTLPLGVLAVLMKTRSGYVLEAFSTTPHVPSCSHAYGVITSSMPVWYFDAPELMCTSTLPLGVLAVLMKTRSGSDAPLYTIDHTPSVSSAKFETASRMRVW